MLPIWGFVACDMVSFTFTFTLHTPFHLCLPIFHFYFILLPSCFPCKMSFFMIFIEYDDVNDFSFISQLLCLELINLRLKGLYPPTTGANRRRHRLFVWWMEFWYIAEAPRAFCRYVFAPLPH
jgi:hypothetical protein